MSNPSQGKLNVVAFGGGTGMPNLLSGFKSHEVNLTAVVVVSDDGGSSGELRSLYNIPAPGDIRNVIVALSEADPDFLNLLQFRFKDELMAGHCLGNLVLVALTQLKGDFESSVEALCKLARVQARVIPAAFTKVALVATHEDGSKSTGEMTVSKSKKPISSISLKPAPAPVSNDLRQRILQADLIVFGPGSLFTSVVPHLLVPGVLEAMRESQAKIVYVANLMTQPGETTNFTLADHVDALKNHGLTFLTAALCHDGEIPNHLLSQYQTQGAQPVIPSALEGMQVWVDSLIGPGDKLRHSSQVLVASLLKHYHQASASEKSSEARVKVVNENGLHTRPASQIVKMAKSFKSEITVVLDGQHADARSIMDLILLTATCGSELSIQAQGPDAPEAVASIVDLVESQFQEES